MSLLLLLLAERRGKRAPRAQRARCPRAHGGPLRSQTREKASPGTPASRAVAATTSPGRSGRQSLLGTQLRRRVFPGPRCASRAPRRSHRRRCWRPGALAGGFPGAERSEPASAAPAARPLAPRRCSPVALGSGAQSRRSAGRGGEPGGGQTGGWPNPRALLSRASQSKEKRLRQNKPGESRRWREAKRGSARGLPPAVTTEGRAGEPATSRASRLGGFSFPAKGPRRDLNRFSALLLSLSPPGSSWPRFLLRLTSTPGALLALRPEPASS